VEERLIELEIRSTHQERIIEELNEIVCRQEQAIERLERDLSLLREQVQQLQPSMNATIDEEEPPPHY
jgi:SlyX protein